MVAAGMNIVRMGEFVWGLCEPREGEFDFSWLKRIMDLMANEDIKVVLATPTAAPPIWLTKKHPEILPSDERGLPLYEGTRHACCLNSDLYWDYSKKIVRAMAEALGKHPQLIAWQIDNNIGTHSMQPSFNEETRRDWHLWLKAKYETIEGLNDMMGTRFWGQTSATGRMCRCRGSRRPRIIRLCCSIGGAFAATRLWPLSGCRRICCMNSPPRRP
jgi:beta-galactosidase